jgi:Ca2+-binding RTX toxin-like protein
MTRAGPFCLAAATVALAVFPGIASSGLGSVYADCWFSPKKGKLTVKTKGGEEATIRRQGKRIDVLALGRTPCKGGRATIRNTNRISFILRGDGITEGHISLAGGPFAPGRTAEAVSPEIEIKVTAPKRFTTPHLDGTGGDDYLRAGDLGGVQGVNLNATAEPLEPDADLRLGGPGATSIWFTPGSGNDTVDLGGGPEFVGPMAVGQTVVQLGEGDDRFVGLCARDFVLAGPGADTVLTGAGDDAINAQDGLAENIDCGEGTDLIQPDQIDVFLNCEQLGSVGFDD